MVRLLLRLLTARQLPGGLIFALVCAAMGVGSAEAATLIVTSTADSGAGSLRAAIAAAGDGDTILFDAALNGQTIGLTSAELLIDKNITISGPGSSQLAIARSPAGGIPPFFRIFHVMPARTVRIEGLKISGGFTRIESGGGVFNEEATLTLDHCLVQGNQNDGGQGGGGGGGGGIYSSGASAILRILDSTVSGNQNTGAGGDGGGINSDGTLTITNSFVTFNSVPGNPIPGWGGGIFSTGPMEITNSDISYNNQAGGNIGGGIFNFGSATITDSSVLFNSSTELGGGIFNGGTMTITNSTISGNRAVFKNRGDGGGVYNSVALLTITNSTLSGNRADHLGASIYNATDLGGGSGTVEIGNSILDAGLGANIYSSPGMVISHGYNLSNDDGGGFLTATGDLINTEPVLGPLQNNGGPTFTHELLTGSPALNAGDPNFTPPPLYDQRGPGYPRVIGGRIDVGSFEVQAAPPTPTPTPFAISGTVSYCSNPVAGPVPNVTLSLSGTMSGATLSAGNGTYSFSVPSGGGYTVTPTKADRAPGSPGITGVDAIAVQRHFLNLGTPLSGCRLMAADVTGSSGVDGVDAIAIQRFFLGSSSGIANTGRYKFTPVNRSYLNLVSNQTAQNFDTLIFGDVVSPFAE